MASEGCTASQLQTLPESLQQHGAFIKPLMKPLITSLCTTFIPNFDEQSSVESVPIDFVDRYFLPSEARASLVQEISKCIENYLNCNTYDFNHNYSIMNRFINEDPKDAPWTPRITQKDNHGDDIGTSTSKNLIQQAAKSVEGYVWGTDMGTRLLESSREQSGNALLEQRVESTHRIITQTGTEFLDPRRAMSTTGVTDQNVHSDAIKPRGCSSYIDGSTKVRQNKLRASPGNNGKGISTAGTGTPSRMHSASAGSTKSTRRESKKQHICPDCGEKFPFEARLKSHQAVHSKTKCECPNCGSRFGRDSSLKRHLNTAGACQKKREARLRNASFLNSPTTTSQHNCYEMDSTSSVADGNSVNNSSLDVRQSTQNFGQHPNYPLNYISQGHSANYGSTYQGTSSQRPSGDGSWALDSTTAYWASPFEYTCTYDQ